ncbi:unnamed protein product [Notodromas monacha]|uniref:CUB domain-containing protein n=1 Tax=Notodromas monacha TaxID=399045 RepID=A0A7R9GHK8_9CRUS|nr:unnamed protein product [Notodromas monacha]CAG0920898.1 unnamed protein product [Notodromas monacha]
MCVVEQKKFDQPATNSPSSKQICGGIDVIELGSESDFGFISSPGYPGNYPNSIISPQDCGAQLSVTSDAINSVSLGFLQLRLAQGDYLSITEKRDDPPSESTEQLTGSYDLFLPDLIVANETRVYLQSNAADSKLGYLAAYAGQLQPLPPTPGSPAKTNPSSNTKPANNKQVIRINVATGETWTDSDNHDMVRQMVQHVPGKQFGLVMSPNHPQNYPPETDFEYQLVAPTGSRIAIRVLRAEFEVCCDYVAIVEDTSNAYYIRSPEPQIKYSSGNEKKVDQPATNSPSSKQICGGIDVIELGSESDFGFISSPGYPGNYPNSIISPQDCGAQLSVTSDAINSVSLGFLQLRLAQGDYLSITEKRDDPPSESTEQLTGSYDLFLPDLIVANETRVYLQTPGSPAKMNPSSNTKPGNNKQVIRINVATGETWTDSDNHDMVRQMVQHVPGKQFGLVMSPNHPQNYPPETDFEYQLVAPTGSRIAIRVLRAEFEVCCDYVAIVEDTSNAYYIRSPEPQIKYSSGNEVSLVFHSVGGNGRGFLIAYSALSP